jgi:hypothetical protein
MLSGYEVLSQHPRATSRQKQRALQLLVQLYEAWNKPDEAAAWRKKLGN